MSRRETHLWQILWFTLVLGLVLRLLSAYFVYGPQALDDYKHGVLPAYQWAAGLPVELPGYRSFLLTWVLGAPLKVAATFGVQDPLTQVRWIYAGLALFSLTAWLGLRAYARTFQSQKFAIYTMILLAVYPLMPFVSTRAFGEALALPLVLSGMTLAEAARRQSQNASLFMLGLLLLGLATFFRFQVGILYVVYGAIFLWRREWRWLRLSAVVGLVLLALQAGLDVLSGREAFASLRAYLAVNEGGAAQYGISPWYNTWLLVFGLTLFPFSVVFGPDLKGLWSRHWRLLLPVFVFVAVHSLMPHKEERFMYPIVGVILLALGELLAQGRKRFWVRRVYVPLLGFVCGLGLLITCFNNTQVGEIGPAALITKRHPAVGFLDRESLLSQSRIKDYFVRPPSQVI
ncbi:MAG: hypothetical protein AB7K41_14125, partial [Bdellovibrionales bacterium]